MTNEYLQQAEDFLKQTETTLTVKESEKQTPPNWDNEKDAHKHIKYDVTLSNKHHTYTFNFWGSIADYQKLENRWKEVYPYVSHRHSSIDMLNNKTISMTKLKDEVRPNAYDILACLSPVYEYNFKDFCFSFDYDADSMKAYKIYNDCLEQDNNLRKLFDRDELEKLSEIQ